jgi:hypothetical protein
MSDALIDTFAVGVISPFEYVQLLFSFAPPEATTVTVKFVTAKAGSTADNGTNAVKIVVIKAQRLRNKCVLNKVLISSLSH